MRFSGRRRKPPEAGFLLHAGCEIRWRAYDSVVNHDDNFGHGRERRRFRGGSSLFSAYAVSPTTVR
jgi:hypothetical protein